MGLIYRSCFSLQILIDARINEKSIQQIISIICLDRRCRIFLFHIVWPIVYRICDYEENAQYQDRENNIGFNSSRNSDMGS